MSVGVWDKVCTRYGKASLDTAFLPQRKALACASRALGPCARGSALGACDVPPASHSKLSRTKVPTTSFEPNKRTTIRLVGLANREVHTKQRFKNQNLRLQKMRIPTARNVFLKCPFNGKAGLLFFNARHDDSGPRRSIFAEKNQENCICTRALQTQRAPKDTDTNAGKHGK